MTKPNDNNLSLDYPPLYCEKCRERISDAHGYCGKCGDATCTEHLQPFASEMIDSPDTPQTVYCEHCHGEIPDAHGYCGKCGDATCTAHLPAEHFLKCRRQYARKP